MMRPLKKIQILMLAFVLGGVLLAPSQVNAQSLIDEGLCKGASLGLTSSECDENGEVVDTLNGLITRFTDLLSIAAGIVAVFMIIFGGLKYIVSSGDAGKVSNAKNTILYAIVGLVVVALAQVTVRYVVGLLGSAGDPGGSGAADS